MADDLSFREHLVEGAQQEVEGDHLLCRAIVLVLRDREIFHFSLFLFPSGENDFVLPVTAFVAYTDAVGVVVLDVAAFDAERSAVVEGAVTGHVEMIARIRSEASLGMITLQLLDAIRLRRTRIATVQHDQVNRPRRLRRGRAQRGQQFRS